MPPSWGVYNIFQDLPGFSGTYLYADHFGLKLGSKARWVSEPLSPTPASASCVKFFYYIDGDTVGTLNVVMESLNSDARYAWSIFERHVCVVLLLWSQKLCYPRTALAIYRFTDCRTFSIQNFHALCFGRWQFSFAINVCHLFHSLLHCNGTLEIGNIITYCMCKLRLEPPKSWLTTWYMKEWEMKMSKISFNAWTTGSRIVFKLKTGMLFFLLLMLFRSVVSYSCCFYSCCFVCYSCCFVKTGSSKL